MSLRWLTVWLVGLIGPAVGATEEPKQAPAKPAEAAKSLADQIAAIRKEHKEREQKFFDDLRGVRDDKKISTLNQEFHAFEFSESEKLKALIKGHEKDPAAFEGILVLVGPFRFELGEGMLQVVLRHHAAHPKMGQLCFDIRYNRSPNAEKLLKEVAQRHPQEAVRGQATYALGDYYRNGAQPYDKKLSEAEEAKRFAEAARHYTEVTKTYAAVTTPDGSARLGDKAAAELIRIKNLPNLKVGKTAPEIVGEDIDGKPLKLSDYRGKVVVLDFWGHW